MGEAIEAYLAAGRRGDVQKQATAGAGNGRIDGAEEDRPEKDHAQEDRAERVR